MSSRKTTGTLLLFWLAAPGSAQAGMTVITLTEIAKARLDALSFFLAGFFVISWLVKLIWNHLAKSFTVMPELNYRRALCLVTLSGLMFYVVLTMISGAREILTPGAWEKQGTGYRLREASAATPTKQERRAALEKLRDEIHAYAAAHDGAAPSGPFDRGMEPEIWEFQGGGYYCLMPGAKPGGGRDILVYEPSTAGGRRFVLLADGTIEDRDEGMLKRQIEEQMEK